ncbi:MAG: squalene--hopene cyclase [Verrucomicrobiaceae bacterium]|nr:MAG: squalene--hopene cyclase [Verrucomicrobiaceae bacterium]
MPDSLPTRLRDALTASRQHLLSERTASGHWEGWLSSSALSTATAVLALLKSPDGPRHHGDLTARALDWLAGTQTNSGGWGDTPVSRPNIATTLLCWAAFGLAGEETAAAHVETVRRCEGWIFKEAGSTAPPDLAAALFRRYGRDKTFAVPILMACAIGKRLGPEPDCWRLVSPLPFELAALPRTWFAALRLPVVSYALPALIAIGQARHHHAPALWPWSRVRRAAAGRTLRLLEEIQPEGGGFLEATPLTSFVSMALSAAGQGGSGTTQAANGFLLRSVRPDGSWPIDTNLATWGTTLSIKALGPALPVEAVSGLRHWLENQQYKVRHPYCLSAPGGWAWTDLPGGVPDADDTAGALLALHALEHPAVASGSGNPPDQSKSPDNARTSLPAGEAGSRWLAGLQNRDGGMPTFCKGWGALPFDRSAPDLTAHALAAWQSWRGRLARDPLPAMGRAVDFLARTQRADGAWLPLWFGNEWEADEANPVFGTATVLKYLCLLPAAGFPALPKVRAAAAGFLLKSRLPDGRWGGGPGNPHASIEETAAAIEALAGFAKAGEPNSGPVSSAELREALESGAEALLTLTSGGTRFEPAPIGLYFARLWYHEQLYPLIGATGALRALAEYFSAPAGGSER